MIYKVVVRSGDWSTVPYEGDCAQAAIDMACMLREEEPEDVDVKIEFVRS